MILEFILLTIIIIVLHVQAGMVWEIYYRQQEARQKKEQEQQNSEEIVNANTKTFAIWEEDNNEQE